MDEREVLGTLIGLGFEEGDARTLADHFLDAERRGKTGHGLSRVEWLATRPFELDPSARPQRQVSEPGYERWDGNGALGYLTLAAIVEAQLADPPGHARLVVAQRTFPTGMLGYWGRKLAAGGLVAALTATSPAELGIAIARGFVPVSFGPPSGWPSRSGEVAVSAATSPPAASFRPQ